MSGKEVREGRLHHERSHGFSEPLQTVLNKTGIMGFTRGRWPEEKKQKAPLYGGKGKQEEKTMSIYGQTKGTELEAMAKTMMQAEANGTMMYYALARLAKEQGYEDLVPLFIEAANQEAVHAGFYAVLNGKYPQDFWGLVKTLQKAETNGEAQVKAMADKVRAAGFAEAADEMEVFAKQEGHHGELMAEILARYPQAEKKEKAKKVYVCPVCGYEYEGDINSESDDWVCPLCGQPKSAFKEVK
jgi:rubrerythrin